ncbi:MAG: methyltransferase domain-containing protein [Bryobacteraceae bacterium]|jgi:cyclopropane fatty-acyl-phospholipid synthase-like methyltransferase
MWLRNHLFRDAAEHYTALELFYEKLTGDLSIHLPLWMPGTQTLHQATTNGHALMAEASQVAPGQYVLDAGCGLGATAFWLARHFTVRVLGVSNSASNVARCRQLARDREAGHLTDFQTADLMANPFRGDTFDSVWNLESINYLCPKSEYIRETFRILKPGGTWVSMDRYGDVSHAGSVAAPLTAGFYTAAHWEGIPALLEYMRQAGFADAAYLDLTPHVLHAPGKRRVGGPRAALALLSSVRHPSAYPALFRAYRIIRASFILMERGQMSYGLLSGTKPA